MKRWEMVKHTNCCVCAWIDNDLSKHRPTSKSWTPSPPPPKKKKTLLLTIQHSNLPANHSNASPPPPPHPPTPQKTPKKQRDSNNNNNKQTNNNKENCSASHVISTLCCRKFLDYSRCGVNFFALGLNVQVYLTMISPILKHKLYFWRDEGLIEAKGSHDGKELDHTHTHIK